MKDKTVTINIFSDDVEIEESHFLLFRFVPYLPLPFFYIINGLEIREFSDNSLKRSNTTFADRQSGGYFLQFFISLLLVLSFAAFGLGFAIAIAVLNMIIGVMAVVRGNSNNIIVISMIIGGIVALVKFYAFTRLDTPKEKGWRIFLLLLGVVGLMLGIQSIITSNVLNSIMEFI